VRFERPAPATLAAAALALVTASGALSACGPAPNARGPEAEAPAPAEAHAQPAPGRVAVLGPEASPVTFERMARFPEPGWHVPRAVAHAPDGSRVTFLASESATDEMALFAYDPQTRKSAVWLRAGDLTPADAPLSREEELRRERQRQRAQGITSYRWARRAPLVVIPHAGDVFVARAGDERAVVRLTTTEEPEIDPKPCDGGERVAFVRSGELVMVDVATRKETRLTTGRPEGVTRGLSDFVAQEELDEPSGFFWSPRCDRIAYLEVDERDVDTVPVVGWRGGGVDLMMQKYPRAGGKNPKVRLGILDVATRKTAWARFPNEAERYLARFSWSDDGRALFFQTLSRDQKRRALVRLDPQTGQVRELTTESSPAWVELSPMKLLPKSGALLTTTSESGHQHLELRRAADGAKIRTLTGGAWDVTTVVSVDEERGRALFVGTKDGPLERHLYSVSLEGGAPQRLTRAPGVHAIYADERGRAWVDVHSSRTRLPHADVFANGARGAEITGTLPEKRDDDLEALAIRAPEPVTLTATSGEPLHGALLRPRHMVPGGKHPAVVIVYGGPGAQTVLDAWSPRLSWQHLADRGFFVFQLDNRGSAGRGVAFQHGVHKQLGARELEDQLAGAAWLASQPGVDPRRLGIHGHSYGGFMTALAMLGAPGRFAVGVSSAPVTDWRLYDTGYTERYMETPESNPEGYARADLAALAPALEGRLLLVHGNMDENVHYAHTARLVDALVLAKKPFDLFVFPGERHGYRSPDARAHAHERVIRYFVDHL
jgi:dipeptidyl-peptidase 4